MPSKSLKCIALVAVLALISLTTIWNFVLADKATTLSLGGADRYLTSISTDKPFYKPGEKMYVRGVMLHANSHKPMGAPTQGTVEVKGPKGDTIATGSVSTQDSVWAFSWDVPKEQAGGEYTVRVMYPWTGHTPAERKFDIRAYRAPRLRSQIVFLRDGYGPGDKVTATLHTERAEGGMPDGARVTVNARVDGVELNSAPGKVDATGNCTVAFDLPKEIARGDGTLALIIEDGGVVETASKTIPILLQSVDVKIYPEGGDLVAGLPSRVYFEARTPAQKPADIAGVVLNKDGKEVGQFRSEHEGRGRFEFTPATGGAYALRIDQPAGIRKTITLPEVKSTGAVLFLNADTYAADKPIMVAWAAAGVENVKLVLSHHETELASQPLNYLKERSLKDGSPYAWTTLDPKDAEGVLIVTLYDDKDKPLAERLIYRAPAKKLNVSVTADKTAYVPGDNVKLTIKTTDAAGKPLSAVVGMTVTDDSILEMVEKREQAPRLPVMVLLEPEVKELADAQLYLDDANPKAPLAVDLLLGTQGWRRFAFVNVEQFIGDHGDAARRVLALRIQDRNEVTEALQLQGAQFDGAAAPGGMAGRGAKPQVAAARREVEENGPVALKAPAAPIPLVEKQAVPAKPEARPVPAPALDALRANDDEKFDRDQAQNPEQQQMQKALNRADVGDKKKAVWAKNAQLAQSFAWIREYAHQVRADRKPTDRVDFAETLYWNAGIKTNESGEASISFGLNDSVTTFRVFADGFSADGSLGASKSSVQSVQPFYVEPKLPLEVTSGDTILLPIGVVNGIGSDFGGATVSATLKGDFKVDELSAFDLPALGRVRQMLKIKVGVKPGTSDFVLSASAGPYSDKVTRTLSVKPKGFPIEAPFGGLIGPEKGIQHKITIPESVVPGSMTSNVAVYPTPLANMTEALQRLIQDPNGCFEQTSSTSYPLTMAQQYFLSHTGIDPKTVEMARGKLDAGYKRLVGFWCPDRGYEWFGQDPGHEALTAFGLLHFSDMAQVRDVDQNMINSTREWLLKQRDGKGGFERKRRALHTWIEDKDCSNAYISWALLETGAKDMDKEVAALKVAAEQSQNSYVLALTANALFIANDKDAAKKLMDRLVAKQDATGQVTGGTASIVGSGGESLAVETTALATLAWLRDPAYAGSVEKSMKFLADSCKAGRYGSTQSTVLALRAIVQYDKQRAHPKAPGKVRVFVDGQSIGGPVAFDAETKGAIKLPDISELLSKGEHTLELKMEGGGEMPYSLAVNYNTITPASSKECKVDIAVKLAQTEVEEGSTTEANVTVTNKTGELIPTPVAIIGIPGGLEARHDQLKELVKKGTIDAYEVTGREVVLYWRGMKANDKVEIPLSLVAAIPGTYTAPASRAYLYYTDEFKQWVDGLKVNIAPKK
jgi:hypothetical protein